MLILAEKLTRRYGKGEAEVIALSEASFSIDAGEFVAVMGPSGSGKSTLMNLIGLLDRPSSGRLAFKGKEVTRLSHNPLAGLRNRDIGFVFQSYNLLARHTALENVELPLVYAGVGREERARRAAEALDTIYLPHRAHHAPGELSGGEQQRVAIARALVNDPALILADEPTGALDSRTGAEVLDLFQTLNERGRTIVIVTHDPAVAAHAARVIKLRDGVIVDDRPVVRPARLPQSIEGAEPPQEDAEPALESVGLEPREDAEAAGEGVEAPLPADGDAMAEAAAAPTAEEAAEPTAPEEAQSPTLEEAEPAGLEEAEPAGLEEGEAGSQDEAPPRRLETASS